MVRIKNETDDSLLSITKSCQKLIDQTHTKAPETLKFKLTKPEKFFLSNHQSHLKDL